MTDLVTLTIEQHVARVTLNRPEKKNALSLEMLSALTETAETLQSHDDIRAVVIHGAGGAFSAGIDLTDLMGLAPRLDEIKEQMRNPPEGEAANLFQKPITVWAGLPVPVIAAIDGVCFGAGMQLALGADFRICAPDARLSIMEAKWGLIPDMGITQSLPRLMRADQAKELVMTGRVLDAPEAALLGLVTRVSENPLEAALTMAGDLAAKSPDAIRAGKQLVDAAWSADPAMLALEAELQAQIMGAPNQMEAVMGQMQKRAPRFT